jgi:WS/DGAT/MGAT family acyltransferase
MAQEIRFEQRMSDSDALMWNIEQNPLLRSTVTVVWVLDRVPDRGRLEDKVERATRLIPRLRQRVVSNRLSIAPPRWEVDPNFDLTFHLRWLRAPGDGSMRALLDLAQPIAMQGFDRARPLWELAVVDGLAEGRAGLVMKLHHSVSDGVGLVQMTGRMIERERDPRKAPGPMPPMPAVHVMSQRERVWDALAHERRRLLGRASRSLGAVGSGVSHVVRDPRAAAGQVTRTVASLGRLLRPAGEPLSPLMTKRSLSNRFDMLTVPLAALRAAAKRVDGKLNDAFVAAVAGGLRLYHAAHGAPVERLRMSMPINLRTGEDAARAGNQFVPARFEVPVGIADPAARMAAIRDLVRRQREEAALPLVEEISAALNRLPIALSTAMFGAMLKGIDFVTSNVPGPTRETYTAGARLESVFGFGPLTGAALNVTLFSYVDQLGIAVNSDPAAIPDSELFTSCLRQGFEEILGVA